MNSLSWKACLPLPRFSTCLYVSECLIFGVQVSVLYGEIENLCKRCEISWVRLSPKRNGVLSVNRHCVMNFMWQNTMNCSMRRVFDALHNSFFFFFFLSGCYSVYICGLLALLYVLSAILLRLANVCMWHILKPCFDTNRVFVGKLSKEPFSNPHPSCFSCVSKNWSEFVTSCMLSIHTDPANEMTVAGCGLLQLFLYSIIECYNEQSDKKKNINEHIFSIKVRKTRWQEFHFWLIFSD